MKLKKIKCGSEYLKSLISLPFENCKNFAVLVGCTSKTNLVKQ